ncbi:MAG: histidine--tRNA ligase [Candidatus Scalindua sp.]|nr:histidine--tRNA ligase [Candidatus Scalindua sp.]
MDTGKNKYIKAPLGMKDLFPTERVLWNEIENVAREEFELSGYYEIRTPVFEDTRLFVRSIGETSDIVEKEMYTFGDTDDSMITLRPENTAPVMRAYLEYELYKSKKFQKFYYIGPMFRKERPQAGRLRQFHQMGVEAVGSYDPLLDVETIKVATRVYDRLGLTGYKVKVNSIGCEKCRPGFRDLLKEELRRYKEDLCELCQTRIERNVFRVLDCKKEKCREICTNVSSIVNHICNDCLDHFTSVKNTLEDIRLDYTVDQNLVRGLDYYTKTVYEITHPAMGARDTICAGGRYDNLISDIGGPPIGAVGFAAGIEASLIALIKMRNKEYQTENPPVTLDAYLVSIGSETRSYCFRLLNTLRQAGVSVDMDYESRSPKAQMRMANKTGAKFTIVIGSEELAKGVIKLKHMQTGEENFAGDPGETIQIIRK